MSRIPMPSPNRTNVERAFLPARLAADAAPRRRARDEDPVDPAVFKKALDAGKELQAAMTALQQFLIEKLPNDDDQAQAEQLVNALLEAASAPDDSDEDDESDADNSVTGDGRTRFPRASDLRGVSGLDAFRLVSPQEAARARVAAKRYAETAREMSKRFPNAKTPRQA